MTRNHVLFMTLGGLFFTGRIERFFPFALSLSKG